jgi:site-specific DNA recombinase
LTIGCKDSFISILKQNIATVLDKQNDVNTESIDDRLNDLQKELLRLANSGSQYMAVAAEIYRLRDMKQSTLLLNGDHHAKLQRIAEMTEFLTSQTSVITQYGDKLARQLVECITVHKERVVVEFGSGVEVGVEM